MFSKIFKKKFIDESLEKQKDDLRRESPELYTLAVNGKDCDSLIDNKDGFGHYIENSIPVNGVLGEMKYLNRLRCKCGVGILYHRLGSTTNKAIQEDIDAYETVCIEGKHWDVLYFNFYHPRRSVWCPLGYRFSDFHPVFSQMPLGYGTNRYDKNFPFGLSEYIALHVGGTLGQTFATKFEEIIKNKDKFIRPEEQIEKIASYL